MIRGLRALMNIDGLQGEVVNLGSENEITILELANKILDICDSESDITHESLPKDDPSQRRPDLTKANKLLDFEPKFSLKNGLNSTANYFDKQEKK
jgi:nucleoside-diphosphate-sugar epimerase